MLQKQSKYVLLLYTLVSVLVYVKRESALWVLIILACGGVAVISMLMFLQKKHEASLTQAFNAQIKSVDQKLEFESTKLEQILEAVPSALAYVNQRGVFDVYNDKFSELISGDAKDVYASTLEGSLRKILLDAFLSEKQFYKQINYKGVDYQVLAVPIFSQERYNGCILVFQDVTQVREGEKMQKRFIADASHELKTPITAIKGMSEIMNREGFDDVETQKEFIQQIDVEADRLDKIVEDLLLQSRLSTNKVHLELTKFNLRQFLDGIVYRRRQQLHLNNIEVTVNCASDIVLEADQFRLSQVMINLFNNAINYAKDKTIRIDCEVTASQCIIKFSDTGKGVNPDILPHIFERFFRGNPDRNRNDGGSGLGLAISRAIIEAHGGSVEVDSVVDQGTCFTLYLPYSEV